MGRHFFQRVNPERMLVHARNLCICFAARFKEGFFAADAQFFQRFEAVRNKRRRDDQQFFDAFLGQPFQFKIRVRLQPGVFAQARLERN